MWWSGTRGDLVAGISPEVPVESACWVETQLTAMERRMDRALELRSGGHRRLLHVEIVADPALDLAFRMFQYSAMLVISLQAAARMSGRGPGALPPVKSVALLLSGRAKPWPREGELRTGWPDPDLWSGHRFQVEPVYRRTVEELLSRPGAFWLVFAPLAVDAEAAAMRRVLGEIRRREPGDDERAELYAAMLVVAELNTWGHNLGEEIRAMMQELDLETIMQSRTLREAFETGEEKGVKKGIEEGVKKGIEEGIKKGRREAIEEMLQDLLMSRMQRELTLDEQAALSSRAATLDRKQMRAMGELDADALMAWLHGPDAE